MRTLAEKVDFKRGPGRKKNVAWPCQAFDTITTWGGVYLCCIFMECSMVEEDALKSKLSRTYWITDLDLGHVLSRWILILSKIASVLRLSTYWNNLLCERYPGNLVAYQLMIWSKCKLIFLNWWSVQVIISLLICNSEKQEFMIHPALVYALNRHEAASVKPYLSVWLETPY